MITVMIFRLLNLYSAVQIIISISSVVSFMKQDILLHRYITNSHDQLPVKLDTCAAQLVRVPHPCVYNCNDLSSVKTHKILSNNSRVIS